LGVQKTGADVDPLSPGPLWVVFWACIFIVFHQSKKNPLRTSRTEHPFFFCPEIIALLTRNATFGTEMRVWLTRNTNSIRKVVQKVVLQNHPREKCLEWHGIQWKTIEYHGIELKCMEYDGIVWEGNQWNTIMRAISPGRLRDAWAIWDLPNYRRTASGLRILVKAYNETPWNTMEYHGIAGNSME